MGNKNSQWDDDNALDPTVNKNQPNSWAIQKITTSDPPFEPHCQAFIPPAPIVPWDLTFNDIKFLKSLKISSK